MKEMKNKTFFIWLAVIFTIFIILFVFSWIKKPNKPTAVSPKVSASLKKPFDARATIRLKDLVMKADINKTQEGMATIHIDEPKTLKDMEFQYDGENIKVSYKGLSVKLDENSKIVSTVAGMIVKSIDKAASGSGISVKMENNALILSGESDAGKFNIVLDKKNKSIVSINLPELDLECNFDSFVFK